MAVLFIHPTPGGHLGSLHVLALVSHVSVDSTGQSATFEALVPESHNPEAQSPSPWASSAVNGKE